MALLHEATISPRKDELVGPWLATRPWWDGEAERGPVGSWSDRTTITGTDVELTVMRRIGEAPHGPTLTGSFEGGTDLRLAIVSG